MLAVVLAAALAPVVVPIIAVAGEGEETEEGEDAADEEDGEWEAREEGDIRAAAAISSPALVVVGGASCLSSPEDEPLTT